jgi:hypothetical protein
MDLASLNPAQRAALAKAEEVGVTSIQGGRAVELTGSANVEASNTPDPAVAAAAAKAATDAAAAAASAAKPQKPEGVPDKFWDTNSGTVNFTAWAKSTSELEKQFTQSRQQAQQTPEQKAAADAAAATAAAAQTPEQKAAAEAAAAAAKATAVDPAVAAQQARSAATADLTKDGKISDASYELLAKSGFDRNTVDTYVAGEQAKQSVYLNSIYTAAGSEAEYKTMLAWAPTTFSAEEVQAFDAAVRSGKPGEMKMAVGGLKARYTAAFGKSAVNIIVPANAGNTPPTGFTSQAEVTKAMQDPRWTKGDPAYRREVTQKIQAAEMAGVDIGLNVMRSGNF